MLKLGCRHTKGDFVRVRETALIVAGTVGDHVTIAVREHTVTRDEAASVFLSKKDAKKLAKFLKAWADS